MPQLVPSDHALGHVVGASAAESGESLLDLLTLERIEVNLFRARNPSDTSRPTLFGGQVAAQALSAAGATVGEGRIPHSLHGYFLRAGRSDAPTLMTVDRDRDGRSFSSRHVNAVQHGEVIFSALASFQIHEDGVDHQESTFGAVAGDPESMPEREGGGHGMQLDMRTDRTAGMPGDRAFWVRPRGTIPDDPLLAACVLTYLSDVGWAFGELEATAGVGGPSLDHAIWLQRPIDPNDWLYVDLRPVTIAGGRGIFTGTIHDRAGRLAAYITQEALLRRRRADPQT